MSNGPTGLELHHHDSNSHDHYKNYEVFFFEMILKKKYLIKLNINSHKKVRRFNNLKYLIK